MEKRESSVYIYDDGIDSESKYLHVLTMRQLLFYMFYVFILKTTLEGKVLLLTYPHFYRWKN